MDSQYDGSLTDLLMNDIDLNDDTIQSNPTVLRQYKMKSSFKE